VTIHLKVQIVAFFRSLQINVYHVVISERAIVISSASSFKVDLMTYFGSLDKKYELAIQNGGEKIKIQKRMFHNSVNFHLNHLKLWI
jgi:hypothetical protein